MKGIGGFDIWRPGNNKKQPNNNITIVYVCGTSKQYVNKHVNMITRDHWTPPVHTFLWAFKEYTLGSLVEEIRDITKEAGVYKLEWSPKKIRPPKCTAPLQCSANKHAPTPIPKILCSPPLKGHFCILRSNLVTLAVDSSVC